MNPEIDTAPASATPGELHSSQLAKLDRLVDEAWEENAFYAAKWRLVGITPGQGRTELSRFPFTTRDELLADQLAEPPLGRNLNRPLDEFKRVFQSSGTTRAPMRWADTLESWRRVTEDSAALWRLADVTPADRVYLAMSLGLSSGPWIISEGARRLGAACLNGAELTAQEELFWMGSFTPTVIAGNPSRLLELAGRLRSAGFDPRRLEPRKLVITGAAAASTRRQLQDTWEAHCFGRYGLTEAGSVAGECSAHTHLHLLETSFIAESIDLATHAPAREDQEGELVLTGLTRTARPIVRYRTGDRSRLLRRYTCACGRTGAVLAGGVSRISSSVR